MALGAAGLEGFYAGLTVGDLRVSFRAFRVYSLLWLSVHIHGLQSCTWFRSAGSLSLCVCVCLLPFGFYKILFWLAFYAENYVVLYHSMLYCIYEFIL